jgi:hypothetical protein
MSEQSGQRGDVRAARQARLEELERRLGEAVHGLVTGEDWKRAMTFAARFRSRSFGNTLLIQVQHHAAYLEGRVPDPAPTYVAGFRQWGSLHRRVVKGQQGYGILAPVSARFASATPQDPGSWRRLARRESVGPREVVRRQPIGFRAAYVWDVSQTRGDPIPEAPRPSLLRGQAPDGLWDGLADQVSRRGFGLRLVSSADKIGGANGLTDFMRREVSVRVDMADAAQVKTLAHELGHVMLHDLTDLPVSNATAADAAMHRGVAEVEAESVALMVAAVHGLDTSSYTVPYVATWAASVPGAAPELVVRATGERVRTTATKILRRLDTEQVSGIPPGLDHDPPTRISEPGRPGPAALRDPAGLQL